MILKQNKEKTAEEDRHSGYKKQTDQWLAVTNSCLSLLKQAMYRVATCTYVYIVSLDGQKVFFLSDPWLKS